jgi:predicted cupin superfamily sugar epimerase
MQNVGALIEHYKLLPHPEGGWYKETYRSKETIPYNSLSSPFAGPRSMATAIFFLLEQGNFSAFHKIQSDECWHFYAGQTLEIFVLQTSGDIEIIRLGNDVEAGESVSTPASRFGACLIKCRIR